MEARWRRRFGEPPPIRATASLLARILKAEEQHHKPEGSPDEFDHHRVT